MISISKSKINAYVIAFFVFQFGILQSVASIVNSQWPIALSTIILLLIAIRTNGLKTKKYVIFAFLITSIYFMINSLIFRGNIDTITSVYFEFALKCFSGFLIGSLVIKGEELFDAFLRVAVINYIAIALFPFVSFFDSMNYMRFGYAMAPSVIMFIYAIMKRTKLKTFWIILGLSSFILTVIYGSRGPLVVFLLFALLLFLFSKRVTIMRKFAIIISALTAITTIIKYSLVEKLIDYIYFNIGINSYALIKLKLMFTDGIMQSSSGRDEIYQNILYYIGLNPIFGHGIGFAQTSLGFTAHNVFLQILIEAGILGLIIWIIIGIYFLLIYRKIEHEGEMGLFRINTLLIALALGRLLVSSDMWLRPELWISMSMLLNYKLGKKYTIRGTIK